MKKTIGTAESCTGGLLAKLLTNAPGASRYYLGGVIAYHNLAKEKLLGVSSATLSKFGAVSEETAKKMAMGVKKRLGADLGMSITGIAGPSGGTKEKPVGLVYIALAEGNRVIGKKFIFTGTRNAVRAKAAKTALAWVRRAGVGAGSRLRSK